MREGERAFYNVVRGGPKTAQVGKKIRRCCIVDPVDKIQIRDRLAPSGNRQ